MTIGEHVYRVRLLAMEFAPSVRFSEQIIQQYVEYAARRMWRALIGGNENRVRKTVQLSHGDHLPDDWVVSANRAYYEDGDGNRIAVKPISIEHVGVRKYSAYNRATLTSPDYYISNQRIYFLPDSTMTDPATDAPYENLEDVTLYHYERPPKLFGQPDNTDDGLPAWVAPIIWHMAYSRCLEHYVSAQKRQAFSEKRRQESLASIKQFVHDLSATQHSDPRART